MAKILLVEDERRLASTIEFNLKREGHVALLAHDGETGLRMALQENPDLVILDMMLPKIPGLQVCRTLRAKSTVPIIILTARDAEADKVLGLQIGADDYVTKPFSMLELMARVEAHLRRAGTLSGNRIECGSLVVDLGAREVLVGGETVNLSRKEFDLLATLARNKGRAVSRKALLTTVWDDTPYDDHTLDVHIRWLREKIEKDPSHPECIQTVRGIGYKLRE